MIATAETSKLLLYKIVLFIIIYHVHNVNGHGRLIEPPSRSSAWRYGFHTPPNYNDHELFCGGFARQQRNGGKCGECGDAWDAPEPRANELGGRWGEGVIVRRYTIGSIITLRIELTASHMGYFEFRVCPDAAGKQGCLDKYVLEIISGIPSIPQPTDSSTRFYPRNGSRIYDIKGKLPDDLECTNCLLQWRYVAGNNWGMCKNGSGAVGCGPQEEFRACADINIGDVGPTVIVPVRPPIRPTMKPPTTVTMPSSTHPSTELPEPGTGEQPDVVTQEQEQEIKYLSIIIAIVSLLFVLCIIAILYIYHYHGKRLKHTILYWKYHKNNTKGQMASQSPITDNDTGVISSDMKKSMAIVQPTKKSSSTMIVPNLKLILPPVPPPRTKRLTSTQNVNEIVNP